MFRVDYYRLSINIHALNCTDVTDRFIWLVDPKHPTRHIRRPRNSKRIKHFDTFAEADGSAIAHLVNVKLSLESQVNSIDDALHALMKLDKKSLLKGSVK